MPFICHACQREFASSSGLNNHQNRCTESLKLTASLLRKRKQQNDEQEEAKRRRLEAEIHTAAYPEPVITSTEVTMPLKFG